MRDALKVRIADAACGTGPSREVEPTTASRDLVEMLPKGTRTKPYEAGARRFPHKLDSIACQEHVNLMPCLDGCCRDEEGECTLSGVFRPAGDMDKKAGHEHLTRKQDERTGPGT